MSKTSPSSNAAAASAATADDWTELARRWQALGAEWMQWWTKTALSAAPSATAPASAMAPADPANDLPAVLRAISIDPAAAAELTARYARRFEALWESAMHGRHAGQPASVESDRRFADRAWREEPYYAWLRDSYLLYAGYITELAALAEGDAASRKRVAFLAKQYVDAIAPSNFLATNPEALRLALESGGASVVQGLSNLIGDAQRGRIAMTDETAFKVGVNLATTRGGVVFRNDLIELIQYAPATAAVGERPLLIVPPCINKYYILDLRPENSFVRYAIDRGNTVFMISWRNIPPELGRLTWDDYLQQGVLVALEVAREIAGGKTINVLGFCVGGTLLACALAVLAARGGDMPVASATFLATMLDFADPGDIGVYVSPQALAAREPELCSGGRIRGAELANAFASLRPNELVWNYVVGNYLKGQTPPAFDLLYWNGDSANLPGPMYVEYLRNMYLDNRLREADALTMCGVPIDLGRIALPAYVLATQEDHIVPWRSAYRTVHLLGGDKRFVLGASGHIAGVINPATAHRRSYRTNEQIPASADAWLAGATSHPGSWWPHWAAWLEPFTGARRDAPSALGSALHPSLVPAPGTYVTERAAA